jgi:hypothetical protein
MMVATAPLRCFICNLGASLTFFLALAAACSSTTHSGSDEDAASGAGGAGGTQAGAGASGAGGRGGSPDAAAGEGAGGTGSSGRGGTGESGTGGSAAGGSATGGTGPGGSGGSPVDCPGAQPCSRTVYRVTNPVAGITRMDPYEVLNSHATGPDSALSQQTARSDESLTAGAETYLFFVLSCPAGREYGVMWEGRADPNSTHEVLVATADRAYVPTNDWPTARVTNVPADRDVKQTVRGLVPDPLGNIFVRVNSSGGRQYTDWLAVGSCI